MAGVMVWSSLMVAVRTEAMPRIIFSARLMSATSALSSSVTIIWDVCGNVIVAMINTYVYNILAAKLQKIIQKTTFGEDINTISVQKTIQFVKKALYWGWE